MTTIGFTSLADKVNVRDVVAQKIGAQYLVSLIGFYKKFSDIDFSHFPEPFVIKCSHDSESAMICTQKATFPFHEARQKITFCLSRNMYHTAREKHYRLIPAQIICEEYSDAFEDCSRDDTPEFLHVHCFNGKPHYIEADFTDSTGREYVNIYNNR